MEHLDLNRLVKELISQKKDLEEELTRKKTIVEELTNKTEYYQKLIEKALDITMVLDQDKNIEFIVGPVKQIFGKEPSELTGTKIAELINDDEREDFERQFNHLLSDSGISLTSQITIPQPDGTSKVLECISQKIEALKGETKILINSRDVTKRVNIQQILSNSQDQLLKAQKVAGVGSWEWEYEKDIFRWSSELQRMIGISLQDSVTKLDDFLARVHKDDHQPFKDAVNEAIEKNSNFEIELQLKSEENDSQIILIRGEVIQEDEKNRIIGTGQYITNLKLAEKKLREYSEQLKNFNVKQDMIIENERNQIAREIHDDLGQMLAVLKMDVYLLKERVKQELDEDTTQNFKDDMRSIFSRFDLLINSVQQITHRLRPEVINDLGLVEAIKWLCSDFEEQTGIDCTFENKSGDLGDMLIEYKNAFFRIVQQALSNVAQHAEASKASVKLNYDEKYLTLDIKDNGKGIRPEKIIHPNSLGLLSMKERSHYLGGEFSMNGDSGEGTRIQLKIPVEEILFKY